MTTVEMANATRPLSTYAKIARRQPVVVTLRGKPIVVLRPLTAEEREDLVVSADPKFLAIVRRSRAQAKEGRVLSLDEVKRRYGIAIKAARRHREGSR